MAHTERTYVLVHGGFHGGWCWARVAKLLRAEGHQVYAPSLTGLGDRAHLANADVNCTTHIQDVINIITYEQLNDVVLVGHSYGGFIIGGVADKIPERIGTLVYLDAIVPNDGMTMLDIMEPADILATLKAVGAAGGHLVPSFPATAFGINAADVAMVDGLLTPQPFGTLIEPLKLTGAYMNIRKKVYVRAKQYPRMQAQFDRVKNDPAWSAFELDCGHDVMLDAPQDLTKILIEAV